MASNLSDGFAIYPMVEEGDATGRAAADDLQSRAVDVARDLPWTVVASREALSAAGVGEAAPACPQCSTPT
jgi:hypothetical protein